MTSCITINDDVRNLALLAEFRCCQQRFPASGIEASSNPISSLQSPAYDCKGILQRSLGASYIIIGRCWPSLLVKCPITSSCNPPSARKNCVSFFLMTLFVGWAARESDCHLCPCSL